MTKTYEELMAELSETQARLAEERKQMHAKLQQEREEMLLVAQAERQEQLVKYQERVAEIERKRKEESDAAEARRIQEVAAKAAADQREAKAAEEYRLYHEKLEEVVKAIAEAEFSEEKHRKDLDDAKRMRPVVEGFPGEDEINVEYPVPPDNKGEAVAGTEGIQESPLMSRHLKHILRQAQR